MGDSAIDKVERGRVVSLLGVSLGGTEIIGVECDHIQVLGDGGDIAVYCVVDVRQDGQAELVVLRSQGSFHFSDQESEVFTMQRWVVIYWTGDCLLDLVPDGT
uniref:Uncharacterized protein n=1 Tax=Cacopsylla melanoneura TaxID=428564 RepID=A0A8D8VY10_9HEMI